jgi:hypothetical protein
VSATPPLAAAAQRLRGKPGRPRKHPAAPDREQTAGAVPPRSPRLLDLPAAAEYLSVSVWAIRDMESSGALRRVQLPGVGGTLIRKVLFDRADLDRLVDNSKTSTTI